MLAIGEVITIVERSCLKDGTVRLRFTWAMGLKDGWVSETGSKGDLLVEPVDSSSAPAPEYKEEEGL